MILQQNKSNGQIFNLSFTKTNTNTKIFTNRNYHYTKRVALFTNARDEKNIKEWAAHHLLIGFDHIVIFDHKSIIPLKSVFNHFDKRVTVIRCCSNHPVKLPLMNTSIKIAKRLNVDWFIYLDADEFVILNKYNNVKDLLNNYHHAHSLSINWLMFGTNHLINEPEGLILENYTLSDLVLNQHVKTFVRTYEVLSANNPHYYRILNPTKMFNLSNEVIQGFPGFNPNVMKFHESPAYIAHYIYQSEETYINRKIKKPTDDTGIMRKNDAQNIHKRHNETINIYPKTKYSENIKRFLSHYENETPHSKQKLEEEEIRECEM